MDLKTWLKVRTNVSNFEAASTKPYELFIFFITVVIISKMGILSDFKLRFFQIAARFYSCHKSDTKLRVTVYMALVGVASKLERWILTHVSRS